MDNYDEGKKRKQKNTFKKYRMNHGRNFKQIVLHKLTSEDNNPLIKLKP